MSQLENIEAIERRLWKSADDLRSNSNYASNEYFLPVMGLIFLRHAYSRFLKVKQEVEPTLPSRGGKPRPLTKEDFSGKGSIFLQEEAQFPYLVNLPDSEDRAGKIIKAMESIEKDYKSLEGVLPKTEYRDLDNDLIARILRAFNDASLEKADGDVFGRIYEYFLTQFADQKAHDGGEFFTPVSLVQMIVNVIEPDHGRIIDPACGSGGMFVQSAHFIENMKENPRAKVTFYGQEKNPTTIRLGQMNLAVHGLEGKINKEITYYDQDPHQIYGKADFVMANPPFNVDEVDATKIKNDTRLCFGLPGVNKEEKVSNGNYLWISYFYSYLNEKGRAGFVMSSQASSAGGQEAKVREKLIKTGHVDVMMAIRGNFFYTRTVPCELWFFNKDKPKEHQDKVLMIDARGVYRQVTRKIFDFSPEQQQNLTAIVWLYRGQTERFWKLVEDYLHDVLAYASYIPGIFEDFFEKMEELKALMAPLLKKGDGVTLKEFDQALATLKADQASFVEESKARSEAWDASKMKQAGLTQSYQEQGKLAEQSRDLVKQVDHLFKLAGKLVEYCDKELKKEHPDLWESRKANAAKKALEEERKTTVECLREVRYFHRQAHWLLERFPEGKLEDVEGLVKLVDHKELAEHDWSLTPGRYVGVAPEEVDEDFDFEEALREVHVELAGLNEEAQELAAKIAANFEGLGL